MTERYVFEHRRGLGDVVVLTAAIRDFKLANPDAEVSVATTFEEVWENNPHLDTFDHSLPGVRRFALAYTNLLQALRTDWTSPRLHFLEAFHTMIARRTGRPVPLTLPRPDLHLTEADQRLAGIEPPYWVVVAGIKQHITVKQWPHERYQAVADQLAADGIPLVQVGGVGSDPLLHTHPPLHGVVNLVGRTTVRELFALVRAAEGVICPITSIMHIAAAFGVPAVVLAGGREDPWWEHYANGLNTFHGATAPVDSPHVFLHAIGRMDCCATGGCMRPFLTPPEAGSTPSTSLCLRPAGPVASCMRTIGVDEVVQSVLSVRARLPVKSPLNSMKGDSGAERTPDQIDTHQSAGHRPGLPDDHHGVER